MTAVLIRGTKYVIRETILKFFLAFLLVTGYWLLVTSPSFAQTASSSALPTTNYQLPATSYQAPVTNFPATSPHSASLAIHNFSHAMSCILIGQSPIAPCLEYKMYQDATGMVKSVPVLSNANTSNGALGLSLSMIGEVIGSKPVSSSMFIANLGEQIGIKSASAQVGGSGSGVLAPIFKLWEVSRNIAYLAMILIFVLVGLMVMFRQKLNPQTVVSIQMALPGLVIGLVMITFSYFLASLISDMAFVGTNIVGYYFSLAQPGNPPPAQLPLNAGGKEQNALSIFSRYASIINTGNVRPALDSIWDDLHSPEKGPLWLDPRGALTLLASMLAAQFALPFGSTFGGWGQLLTTGVAVGWTATNPQGVITWSITFIAMLALIYSMFRLILRLINSYLSIIFLTIAAPFYFLGASIPGRQSLATSWMFNMLCNVLAFPAVFAVFYFVAYLIAGDPSRSTDPLFAISRTTPLANNATFPLLGNINLSFLNSLVAFGALVAAPSIPDAICKVVGKPGAASGLLAGAIGGAIAQGQKYQGQVQGGATGFAGNVGRLTDTKQYHPGVQQEDGTWKYDIDPYHSSAGLISKAKANWRLWKNKGAAEVPPAPIAPKA